MFSSIARIPYRRILDMFNRSEFDKSDFYEYRRLLTFVRDNESPAFIITEKERQAIRLVILTNFNSYTAFCMKHGEYDVVYLTNVIRGNLLRKTEKFNKFTTFLKTKYNGTEVFFLPRHGKGHFISPSKINFRAKYHNAQLQTMNGYKACYKRLFFQA
jgi:hypothetical protein